MILQKHRTVEEAAEDIHKNFLSNLSMLLFGAQENMMGRGSARGIFFKMAM
jgi:hypothetical protein